MYFLTLAAESHNVNADDFRAVKTFVGIHLPSLFIIGRHLVDEQLEGMHAFVLAQPDMGLAEEDGTLIFGGKLTGEELDVPDDA